MPNPKPKNLPAEAEFDIPEDVLKELLQEQQKKFEDDTPISFANADKSSVGIVTPQKIRFDTPLILHNIGRGTEESDILYKFPISGHFRY